MISHRLLLLVLLATAACSEGERGPPTPAAPEIAANDPARPVERKSAFTVRLPGATLEVTLRAHVDACRPPLCEVTLVSTDLAHDPAPRGELQARVAPEAMAAFTERLVGAGRIMARRDSVQDLTAPTLDAQARLTAQRALRERLSATLNDRAAMPLADLLAWERELARVQGELEGAESQLRSLSTRAATIAVAVTYEGERSLVLPRGAAPIEGALRDGLSLSVASLAEAIRFVLIALPWLPILALGFVVLDWLRRRTQRGRVG